MNWLSSNKPFSLASAFFVLASAGVAAAQTTLIPTPFVSTIAGQPAGGSNSACPSTADIPDSSSLAVAGAGHYGDGCLPTQATIAGMYDIKVDTEGNIYFTIQKATLTSGVVTPDEVKVIYKGGATLTAVLTAANSWIPNFAPVPGRIYTLAGGLTGLLSQVASTYYCGNVVGSQLKALDSLGDGCPATLARISPRGLHVDQYGNIYVVNGTTKYGPRIIFAGGDQVAKLITKLNPTVPTPQVGYIYQLGFGGVTGAEGDGGLALYAGMIYPRYITVDLAGNVYISDGTNGTTTNGVTPFSSSGENVRMIDGTTGFASTVAGETTCGNSAYVAANGCPLATMQGINGDNGPATSALLNYPTNVFLDQYNNLFIGDSTDARLRVVYRGGTLAGISNPQVGYIYTYAGASDATGVKGTVQASGTPAQQLAVSNLNGAGIDRNGFIYILDSGTHQLYKIDPTTGIANIIGGGPSSTGAPAAGKFCSGTSGPVSTDNFGDGCPAQQAYLSAQGTIASDVAGNLYLTQVGAVATGNEIVQELSYNNVFPDTAVGSSVSQLIAFTTTAATTQTARAFTVQGNADGEYTDAGNTACTSTTTTAAKGVCVVNVKFTPSHAGQRPGQITLSAGAVAGSEFLTGKGIAADVAVDNGNVTTLGAGISPAGVVADTQGNVYVSDSKGGQVLKKSGATLTPSSRASVARLNSQSTTPVIFTSPTPATIASSSQHPLGSRSPLSAPVSAVRAESRSTLMATSTWPTLGTTVSCRSTLRAIS